MTTFIWNITVKETRESVDVLWTMRVQSPWGAAHREQVAQLMEATRAFIFTMHPDAYWLETSPNDVLITLN